MKKGIELQFHWIFVMIAGALILIFFFSIANRQRTISQERLQLTLATDVENIFTGAIVSRGTAQRIPVPPQGIQFQCTEGCDCKFMIGRAQRPFGYKALFAPSILKDQDMTVWALEFKAPYRVTNLLFLTNPNVKYYFVKPETGPLEQIHKQLTKNIPPLIEYENISITDVTSVQEAGYQHTKLIFFGNKQFTPPSLDDSYRRESFSGIRIDEDSISFFEKDGTTFQRSGSFIPWLGTSSLYAAIFAEDKTMYECGLQTVFRKLSYLSRIYAERSEELQEISLANEKLGCEYGEILSLPVVSCVSGGGTIINTLLIQQKCAEELQRKLDASKIKSIGGLSKQLEQINMDLVQKSCPEVF